MGGKLAHSVEAGSRVVSSVRSCSRGDQGIWPCGDATGLIRSRWWTCLLSCSELLLTVCSSSQWNRRVISTVAATGRLEGFSASWVVTSLVPCRRFTTVAAERCRRPCAVAAAAKYNIKDVAASNKKWTVDNPHPLLFRFQPLTNGPDGVPNGRDYCDHGILRDGCEFSELRGGCIARMFRTR